MAAGAGHVGIGGSLAEKCGSDPATDESSESEGETETSKAFHRRVSTSKAIKNGVCIKEGYLMKQTTSFQRWKRRYFKLKPRKLYYAKDNKSVIFEEVDLTDLSLAECSPKNINHSFQLITPFRRLILCAETRKEMEEWMSALKSVSNKDFYEGADHAEFLSGQHNWYVASHARPTYCNVCKEALSGVTSHGLSCEVCKFKAHKRCAVKAANNCKWTTLSSVGKDIIEDESGNLIMPHQWLEGNLPVSGKCAVCDKTCGSVLRLQDWRCLWCRAMVHTICRSQYPDHCPLGLCRTSVVPPTALHSIGNDESWEAVRPVGCSPLLVFVNSKSGDNQGVKFLRRFKQLLNPAQVFDLMNGGPELGIRMFKSFNPFRILVCGGDGSVSWVLTEIDKHHLHNQCQIGVLPLGTGNDLARVLGWGSVCDDDAQLPQLLEKYERATSKLLDRWSIMTYEGTLPITRKTSSQYDPITVYEDSVVAHLTKILQSDQHSVVISSAKVLCETVKDFIAKVAVAQEGSDEEDSIAHKCVVLNEKLDSLLKTLNEESEASQIEEPDEIDVTQDSGPLMPECDEKKDSEKSFSQTRSRRKKTVFIQKEALMSRANSLKKAVRQIIEHTEKAVDEQNAQTQERQDQQEKDVEREIDRPDIVIEPNESQSDEAKNNPKALELDVPVFKTTFCEDDQSSSVPCWNPWGQPMGQSVGAPLKDTLQVTLPTILGGASVDSSPCPSPRPFLGLTPSPAYSPCVSPIPSDTAVSVSPLIEILRPSSPHIPCTVPGEPDDDRKEKRSPIHKPKDAPTSPKATRRISSGSTLKKMGHIGLQLSSYGLGVPLYPPHKEPGKRRLSEAEDPEKKDFPIINPLASLPMWPNLNKDSLIGKVLLANSDVLCAAASPLMNVEETCLDGFEEKCVMNNYFGIGLDAKITLEFHNKREEHPEKCRSRTKNLMWYGVLGGKELLQRTFKNLEQRVQLECDGYRIPLPSLQGIVVLNIPSYGGGSNFWGNPREGEVFYVPTFDDKILEVLAVFGTVQMAASRVINLQHHRIAQCRSVKITILGDEGVPIQVDGEAWIQPPGYICLVHKNRTQVLCRNRQLESHLKTWQERQRTGNPNRSLPALPLAEDELQHLVSFVHVTATLVKNLKSMAGSNMLVEHELIPLALQTLNYMDKLFPSGKVTEGVVSRQEVSYFVASVRNLFWGTSKFLQEKFDDAEAMSSSDRLLSILNSVENEMKKCSESQGVVVFHGTEDEEQKKTSHHLRSGLFKLKFKKQSKSSTKSQATSEVTQVSSIRRSSSSSGGVPAPSGNGASSSGGHCGGAAGCGTPPSSPTEIPIRSWRTLEVVEWLDSIQMSEYKENFVKHDIHGPELLDLERRDLKELGITKVGHIKRILQAIKDISSLPKNR